MKIGIAQLSVRAGDFSRTSKRMSAYSKQAAAQGVELLIFPLATLVGMNPVPEVDQEGLFADISQLLEDLAPQLACACLVPLPALSNNRPLEEVFYIADGKVIPLRFANFARSHETAEYLDTADITLVDSDTSALIFTLGDLCLALALHQEMLDEVLESGETIDAVVYFSEQRYAANDIDSFLAETLPHNRYVSDAVSVDMWLIAVGSLGGFDQDVYTGGSFVLDPAGQAVAVAPSFEEALTVAEIEPLDGLGVLDDLDELDDLNELDEQDTWEVWKDWEERIDDSSLSPFALSRFSWSALSLAVKDFVEAQEKQDVVLVLDGTLNSAILAVLLSDALGPMHVHALLATPLEGTPALRSGARGPALMRARSAAQRVLLLRQLANYLNIQVVERNPRLVQASAVTFQDAASDEERLATIAAERDIISAEARKLAREHQAVLVSSVDKTWLALEAEGMCASADLLPFGDLYRSNVLAIARARHAISPVFADLRFVACDIPELLDAFISVGEQQVVEEQINQLDYILSRYVEEKTPPYALSRSQENPELVAAMVEAFADHRLARRAAGMVIHASTMSLDELSQPLSLHWFNSVDKLADFLGSEDYQALVQQLARLFGTGTDQLGANDALTETIDEMFNKAVSSKRTRDTSRKAFFEQSGAGAGRKPRDKRPNIADLIDYMKGLGLVNPENSDGHIVADQQGHMGFGGLGTTGSPFSEN